MDLLQMPMPIDLYDKNWRIYGRNPGETPHYIGKSATVKNCLVTEGCEVFGSVSHSVLFSGVTVLEGAVVEDSIVMPNAVIERGAIVRRAIVAEKAVIGAGATVGETDGEIAVVGNSAMVEKGGRIKPGQQYRG